MEFQLDANGTLWHSCSKKRVCPENGNTGNSVRLVISSNCKDEDSKFVRTNGKQKWIFYRFVHFFKYSNSDTWCNAKCFLICGPFFIILCIHLRQFGCTVFQDILWNTWRVESVFIQTVDGLATIASWSSMVDVIKQDLSCGLWSRVRLRDARERVFWSTVDGDARWDF